MDSQIIELVARLGEVAVRNTAGVISDRIRAAKAKRNDAESIAELEEIITSLISDKNEVVQIAQALEQNFVAQRISTDEINYVTTHLIPVIEQVAHASAQPGDTSSQDMLNLIKPLLSGETLTVLQVLGFNFKQAIGEPLTILLRALILANVPVGANDSASLLSAQQSLEFMRLAQDPDAFARFQAIAGSDDGD